MANVVELGRLVDPFDKVDRADPSSMAEPDERPVDPASVRGFHVPIAPACLVALPGPQSIQRHEPLPTGNDDSPVRIMGRSGVLHFHGHMNYCRYQSELKFRNSQLALCPMGSEGTLHHQEHWRPRRRTCGTYDRQCSTTIVQDPTTVPRRSRPRTR